MIIRKATYLKHRDIAIHEASHFAVGTLLKLPMQLPEVFRDGSGGIAPFDREEAHRLGVIAAPYDPPEQEAKAMGKAGVRIAAVFLAGCAGEAIHFGVPTDIIIGGRTPDMLYAGLVLELAGQPISQLSAAWEIAVRLLRHAWPAVVRTAELIPVTGGTYRPPRFN